MSNMIPPRPPTQLLNTTVKLFRYPIGDITKKIHCGSATKLKIIHQRARSGTSKLRLVGHKGPQCNINGYIGPTANPALLPDNKTVFFYFFNQAFRVNDTKFGRNFEMECSSPEVANKVVALMLLAADAARLDSQREQPASRRILTALYDSDTTSEGEEEKDKEGKKQKIFYITSKLN